jgi:sulfur carrier protein
MISMTLNISINGELRSVPDSANPVNLNHVLTSLAVRKDLVAIALNDTIVPRAQWSQTLVSEGDRVEIVHFVGGGCSPLPKQKSVRAIGIE